ncbi:hypothetical protein Tco_1534017 [Tanacetum coccineum]
MVWDPLQAKSGQADDKQYNGMKSHDCHIMMHRYFRDMEYHNTCPKALPTLPKIEFSYSLKQLVASNFDAAGQFRQLNTHRSDILIEFTFLCERVLVAGRSINFLFATYLKDDVTRRRIIIVFAEMNDGFPERRPNNSRLFRSTQSKTEQGRNESTTRSVWTKDRKVDAYTSIMDDNANAMKASAEEDVYHMSLMNDEMNVVIVLMMKSELVLKWLKKFLSSIFLTLDIRACKTVEPASSPYKTDQETWMKSFRVPTRHRHVGKGQGKLPGGGQHPEGASLQAFPDVIVGRRWTGILKAKRSRGRELLRKQTAEAQQTG